MQPALPGFDHVERYWDSRRESCIAKLMPGEFYVTQVGELVCTVLGSGVAACVRDRVHGIGGMNHFILAGAFAASADGEAMEHLIDAVLAHGGKRQNLELKIFGGASLRSGADDAGARSVRFVRDYVRTQGLSVVADDLGGQRARKVTYQPSTGRAWLKRLSSLPNDTLLERELRYRRDLEGTPFGEDDGEPT